MNVPLCFGVVISCLTCLWSVGGRIDREEETSSSHKKFKNSKLRPDRRGKEASNHSSMKLYLYLPKGLNFSLTSNISLRRKLKTQAESDFIHILRYSDKILVGDPGEKKCSVRDVRCFLLLIFIFFFRAETPTKRAKTPTKQAKTPEMRFSCKTVNFFNTVINNIYSVSGHLNQTSSKSLKNTIGQKKTPQTKKIHSG